MTHNSCARENYGISNMQLAPITAATVAVSVAVEYALVFFFHNYYNTRATLISTTYRLLVGTRP